MTKHSTSLKYILKINSSTLRKAKWDYKISLEDALENDEIVSLADSSVLRFIKEIEYKESEEKNNIEDQIDELKNYIKKLKKSNNTPENRKQIKSLYSKLNNLKYFPKYICVVIDKISDFDRMNRKKGFYINGFKFKRLLATTGGAKNSTVVYIQEDIYDEITKRIDNGRNKEKPIVPAKLEAYKALACSASVPVSNPNGIIVIDDCLTEFYEDVIRIYDEKDIIYPKVEEVKNYKLENNASDGFGLAMPSLTSRWNKELGNKYIPSGLCIRGSFLKGMVFTFDFKKFAAQIAEKDTVVDIWGTPRNINDAELILTSSMLKLWNSYESLEHYLSCCDENKYTFSVTKVSPEQLENQRNLNYQFIQSFDLDDQQIDELIKPTVDMLKDSLGNDHMKSLLFLKGNHLADNNIMSGKYDFSMALMADKRMIDDPFVKNRIHDMLEKRIDDAKKGDLIVDGNFSIVSGDPYTLCQSMFGLKKTGLLNKGEYYNSYWNKKGVKQVVAFRAPMTLHNNIRVLDLVNEESVNEWYKYMNTVTIINSFDSTASALNGMDFDADMVLTVNNQIIKDSVKRLKPIICTQNVADKKVPTEADLIKANKLSFGDEIGSVTNRGTAMYDVLAKFDKNSKEYDEIMYRITCVQHFQQNAIDKTKGIESKPMPKEWYDGKFNTKLEVAESIKGFNNSILADKKPYFFIYIYPHIMKNYKRYIANNNTNCNYRFGISLKQLINKNNKSQEEDCFIQNYLDNMPVSMANSTMNKICWRIEDEFKLNSRKIKKEPFDYKIMKSNKFYDKDSKRKVSNLYLEHNEKIQIHMRKIKSDREDEETKAEKRQRFISEFKKKALSICNDIEELTNIILDICYKDNSKRTKQFAWDVCGEQIIRNLLKNNGGKLIYPVQDEYGDINYGGLKFKESEKICEEDDFIEFGFE
ncbi:hypothetical protein SAMN04487895_101731 [Paenibacillus sophorae]|uniref:RNA dependent RNA polymerase n=1 Tax=Paenibacillus sophorae TaxID=1333845 RepID=A0A1H8H2P2_9BACL|nr:hypothetical protein [Paenibacillus sophorae]QWU14420.1 hypothetical protein KP014_21160 [Paenibacillus sophorae]SEN50279.1 hypothetical protein SAMN04487895_101731 [Paenibacillus sophorae]